MEYLILTLAAAAIAAISFPAKDEKLVPIPIKQKTPTEKDTSK